MKIIAIITILLISMIGCEYKTPNPQSVPEIRKKCKIICRCSGKIVSENLYYNMTCDECEDALREANPNCPPGSSAAGCSKEWK